MLMGDEQQLPLEHEIVSATQTSKTDAFTRRSLWRLGCAGWGESRDKSVRESTPRRAVLVQCRVVDGDFQADGVSTCHCDLQDGRHFIPTETVREAVVDRRHDAVVETIGIEMDKESVKRGTRQTLKCKGHCARSILWTCGD